MEKLVKLLKEYAPDYCKDYPDDIIMDEIVISKRFGFIKWLVDNDKIDLDMVREKFGIPCFVWYIEGDISCVNDKEDYKQLLMLLSISDTPIDDLISYLR